MSSIASSHTPLLLGAVLLYQCVLLQGLGLCPLRGQTHDPRRVLTVAAALAAATALAGFATALVRIALLAPHGLDHFAGYAAVLCVALSAQGVTALLRRAHRFAPADHAAALLLQLAVLGVVLAFDAAAAGVLRSLRQALLGGLALALTYTLGAALRDRLALAAVPAPFQGAAIQLLTAGLVALALMGFAGLV